MSSSSRGSSLSVQLPGMLEKMRSTDSDLRLMALIDLNKDLARINAPAPSTSAPTSARRAHETPSYADEHTEREITTMVLRLLDDPIAEVKNMTAVQDVLMVHPSLGAMVKKARPPHLMTIVNDLLAGIATTDKENEENEGRRDISCLALKAVVLEMPTEGQHTAITVDTIINKVYPLLTKASPPKTPDPQLASELLQILTDIYIRFAHIVTSSPSLQQTSLEGLLAILTSSRPSIRKRAIPALSALVSNNPHLFDTTLKGQVLTGLAQRGEAGKTWASVVASLARGQSASKVGALISEGHVVEAVLAQTEDLEDCEAVEGALVAIEVLVLRCPTEITPYVAPLTQKALQLVKYDPNYAELSDDDVDMDEDDEFDDDFEEDAYADDEDVSWKVRRSAAKLLHALIGTRNELLFDFYKGAAPTLIARFSEREESVRLEVLSAFEALLRQTSAARAAELASGGRNKRKRSEEMDDESATEESATSYLRAALPQVLRATLKQLGAKSMPTRQECFVILRHVADVLNGGIDSEAKAICGAAAAALRSSDGAATSSLTIAALSFLAVFFKNHSPRHYVSYVDDIVPPVILCMKDKLQRVNFEAFAAASALASSVRAPGSASPMPASFSQPVQRFFTATTEVLADTSVDGEVRERALDTLGTILVHEGDALAGSYSTCLPLIQSRLASETTASTAVIVIGKIAESPSCKGPQFEKWLLQVLPEVVVALRRSRRTTSKNAEFACLQSLLNRVGSALPLKTAQGIVSELKPFIDTPTALQVVALILAQQPGCRDVVDSQLLPQIMEIVRTPSVNPHLVDALVAFFGAYVDGDVDCATRLVPTLIENLGKAGSLPDATAGGTSTYTSTARCIGAVVAHSQRNAAGVLAVFQKTIKSSKATESDVYLALLCIGEIGRISDLSASSDLFERILAFFKNDSEEVRSAAAFAAGNIAVGAPKVFLPFIIKRIESSTSGPERVLLLHALKEVILHSPAAQLETLADSLWAPLFADDGAKQANGKSTNGQAEIATGDDGVRNVKAACIGKLTTTAPAKFLPQLQNLLRSTAANRALVAAAVRYTFIDTSSAYDELIAPIIVEFLSLMHDENLIVRRLSLASLNAAIQNKPHLIIDRLAALQPLLYQETIVRPELKREVMMGPFKMIEDDGLENRKTAYETMYTLLATCFNRIDLPTFTDRVMAALQDVNEIKVLGLMLLLRLGQLAPTTVVPRLDDAAEPLKIIMKDVEVKDDTVKQDLERKEEMQRSALRTAVPLYRMSTPQQAPAFHHFVGGLLASQQWKDYRDYQA
ncbi:hypothetical protein JCM24511_09575 [Saitozyma sp. JCM 24511]|nr:hypothetical protein JCM24511_09575 [Saitozyma sp. JCM 24511]